MCTPSRRLLRRTVKVASSAGTIAALALAMAVPAVSQETSGTDKVFQLTTVIGLNNTGIGNYLMVLRRSFPSTSAGSIRCSTSTTWLTAAIRRSTSSISSKSPPTLTQVFNEGIFGVHRQQRHLRSGWPVRPLITTPRFGSETMDQRTAALVRARGRSGCSQHGRQPKKHYRAGWRTRSGPRG